MKGPTAKQIPRLDTPVATARAAGVLYVLNITTIFVAVSLFRGIMVSNDLSDMVIVLFGFHFLLIAMLILRSTLLPRALGVLVGLAGAGALTMLMPPVGRSLFPYFVAVSLAAEVSLALWLALRGVDLRDSSELRSGRGRRASM